MSDNNPNPINSFSKGLIKDLNGSFQPESSWTHARNVVNNSHDGQLGVIGNEPATLQCIDLPYQLIGSIPLEGDQWALFSTDDTNSEIGLFIEGTCTYTKIVNDPCLGFNRKHLITGAARRTFDCSFKVYWDDGLNPSRVLDINNVPWITTRTLVGTCYTETPTDKLNCEQLRLAPLITVPCISLSKSTGSGTLSNGTYQVAVAYMINSIRITDYLVLSNPVSLFDHNNIAGSVTLSLSNTDTNFTELEVVVISMVNAQVVAKRLGVYSVDEHQITIDTIDPTLPTIPLDQIPLQSPAFEKSDTMYAVGDYLLRVGVYSKPDFNYQPQANIISVKWASVEYPADYYHKAGTSVGYLRDEQYAFFIRWIYNTGEKSASYHIPGRKKTASDTLWESVNTATITSLVSSVLPDGGVQIAAGEMGYWESTELYPDDKPVIWGDLCGAPQRHHKFPDNTVSDKVNHFSPGGDKIRVLGVLFDNITHPLDNTGNPITSIVGYEILRGSREGNKTVIAKGMLNNMRQYDITGSTQKGLFQNYPFNDLRVDRYISGYTPVMNNLFSFHSPDTDFSHPYIGGGATLKLYEDIHGTATGSFEVPYRHPEFKVLSDTSGDISKVVSWVGTIGTIAALLGGDRPITLTGDQDMPFNYTLGMSGSDIPSFGGVAGPALTIAYELISTAINAAMAAATAFFTGDAIYEQVLRIIQGLVPLRQYATQYNAHGFYNNFTTIPKGQNVTVQDYTYLKGHLQSLGNYSINNLYRDHAVILQLSENINPPGTISGISDTSRYVYSDVRGDLTDVHTNPIVSYYGAVKVSLPSQYGQVESVRQILISGCNYPTTPVKGMVFTSPVLFGGDIYINRYTEKNPMLFFNDWLYNVPDETPYNYRNYYNIPSPAFWLDNRKMYGSIFSNVRDYYHLDGEDSDTFFIKKGYFYLFCNGVRDFFVESEVNVGYRDWEDEVSKRFYDPYGFTDLSSMFRSDIIKSDPFYKYDTSLSASRFYNQYISWGSTLERDYDPLKAYTCFDYYPRRVIYSLPQSEELKKDNWQSFLVNNYKDFPTSVTSIKSINKNGALILLADDSPVQFQGVDTLQTNSGTKITIGDGGLFNQALQSVSNAEKAYQHGSCQGKYSVTATPYGVFWVSQNTGKIFQYGFGSGMEDITKSGMKYWFANYLPSKLLAQFPEYNLPDNPVIGIGVQSVYDNTNEVLYITKKDCSLKPEYKDIVHYDPDFGFYKTDGSLGCPPGYTLAGNMCVKVIPAVPTGTPYFVAPSTFALYGQGTQYHWSASSPAIPGHSGEIGTTLIYTSNFSSVTGAAATPADFEIVDHTNSFWFWTVPPTSGCTDWGTPGYSGDCDDGPVNRIMIWNDDGTTNYKVTDRSPVDTWIGFTTCLTVPDNDTYYFALTADNDFRVTIDGTVVVQSDADTLDVQMFGSNDAKRATWLYLHIYPIGLTKGTHVITLEGYNDSGNGRAGSAGFGAEIYHNTKDQIKAATGYNGLNVIFSTRNQTQFNNTTYGCPSGYTEINNVGPCQAPQCQNLIPATLNRVPIAACDPMYFTDASWTASYDAKYKAWISLHDWHPDFVLPSRTHFLTSKNKTLWRHNDRFDLFCNFYGIDYPFEIGYRSSTGSTVTTMRSVEYMLESYRYKNETDKFQVYDFNFDRAMVFNTEQHSGLLKLNPYDGMRPVDMLEYPKFNPGSIDILYRKVEQKYRFNQFSDITTDRGEFNQKEYQSFITDDNGYTYTLNPVYMDYKKPPLQRKKFRNYSNQVILRRTVSGNTKMLLKLSDIKIQLSSR